MSADELPCYIPAEFKPYDNDLQEWGLIAVTTLLYLKVLVFPVSTCKIE